MPEPEATDATARRHVPRHSAPRVPRSHRRRWIIAAAAVVVLAGVGGYVLVHRSTDASADDSASTRTTTQSSTSAHSDRIAVAAQVALRSRREYRAASPKTGSLCTGVGGYRDIRAGTRVVITGRTSSTLGTARLAPGYLSSDHSCVFAFTASVATGRGPYRVRISDRTAYRRTAEQLRSLNLVLR
jgi:hypothetical protein